MDHDAIRLAALRQLETVYAGAGEEGPWVEAFYHLRRELAIDDPVLVMEECQSILSTTRRRAVRLALGRKLQEMYAEGRLPVSPVDELVEMVQQVIHWEKAHNFAQVRETVAAVLHCVKLHYELAQQEAGPAREAHLRHALATWRGAWQDRLGLRPEPAALALAGEAVAQAVTAATL